MFTLNDEVKVVLIKTEEEFFGLEKEWNTILQESRSDTIFLTWEWLNTWWKAYGNGKELYVLQILKNGDKIGLVPLYRRTISKYEVLSFRALTLLGDGSGDSDYLDWIALKGQEELVGQAVVEFLFQHSEDWDLILLNEIPETSPNIPIFRRLFGDKGCYFEQISVLCPYVNLPAEWDDYIQSLKPRMRTKIRSLSRQLEENHKIAFVNCEQTDELPFRLESFFDLHNQRWRKEGKEGVFVSQTKRHFYEEMSSLFLSRGWLRFYSLNVDGRFAAHQFCFEYGKKMFLLQEGYDPKWTEFGVGNVLRAYIFRDCINRKLEVYDFLGGVTQHKLSWGALVKNSFRISIGSSKIKNGIFFNVPKGIELGKKGLKLILPEQVLQKGRAFKRALLSAKVTV
jgi:CelD/BcsL family acetyltransferase involved in cellulose biosynthesis